ncbi:MAG: hypothetical protein PHE52_01870 [Candidatus Pacebacteria bacterium]|nr:hypothetical protein [Candidatus Paceibacterota bacterium]
MKVNIALLKPGDEQILEKMGIVVDEEGAHFEKKELPPPPGMMRLTSGKLIPHESIQECLAKNR